MTLQTEFEFTLPMGFVDKSGNVHQKGIMRLATAMDEIAPLQDMRLRQNEAYLIVILLSRVIVKLGDVPDVNTGIVEKLFAADLAYLQEFYRQINESGTTEKTITCPECNKKIVVDLAEMGGQE